MHGLGEECRAHRVAVVPPFVEVPAPAGEGGFAEHVDRVRAEMPGRGLHDGPIGIPVAAGPDAVRFYRATYAWHIAEGEGAELPLGRGMIGAALVLDDGTGRMLWQQRAGRLRLGGSWDVAAAGSWRPGEDPVEAAFREAVEEIGVRRDQMGAADAMWVAVGPPPRGVTILVRARLAPDARLTLDPSEVADARWASDPPHGVWPMRLMVLRAAGVLTGW